VQVAQAAAEDAASPVPLRDAVDAYQKQLISQCLNRHHFSWAAAARELGIDRANLMRLAKRLGVCKPG
jgi:anaerobic nitric oxide reductase transcription regulator